MYQISDQLIHKYATAGPRYTSYPTAPVWEEITLADQQTWLQNSRSSKRPLSLYLHIPFCWERCIYCGCNVLVTHQQGRSKTYVNYLLDELDQLSQYLNKERKIRQLHFGGGTPNFLLDNEFELIMERVHTLYQFEKEAEIAIELDPTMIRPGQLELLSRLGFNRLSMGVQDFDERVQKAVKRVQSKELTKKQLEQARELGFKGINFDLIYGLPYQTRDSFQQTIADVIKLRPDRLAIYNFAYLPEQLPHQRKIDPNSLPTEKSKLDFLFSAINELTKAGYRYIGMDHFALEEDELSIAQKNKTLYRNFMGYTPKSGVDLYGVGSSSIGEFGSCFIQNEKKVGEYQKKIEQSALAGVRGIQLRKDDEYRKWTIIRLICHFYLSFEQFKEEFEIEFCDYFSSELDSLAEMQKDGLLEIKRDWIEILNPGKILIRNVCMVFDAYLQKAKSSKIKFSKTI